MKERVVDQAWRTVQLFLTKDYVAEVEINVRDNQNIRCNCLGFSRLKRCNHIKFVKSTMMNNAGHYTVHIPHEVDEELAEMAMEDAELFRQFIIDYGKVEVVD